jgi:hypothetical protein
VLAIAHKNASVGMNRNGESQHRNLRPEKVLS